MTRFLRPPHTARDREAKSKPGAVRLPWPPGFPLVYVHCGWDDDRVERPLADHPSYWPAKKGRRPEAALRVCQDMVSDSVLDIIFDAGQGVEGEQPIVAAPALSLDESQNALAIGYARWLASEMKWEPDASIFQARSVGRDFVSDGWFRLAQQPEYYGQVQAGRRYVLADDVCTMGGTMASLRGFIESKGGHVILMRALASGDGRHVKISLVEETKSRLSGLYSGEFPNICQAELGYAYDCLTEPEGRFVLRCPSPERFRAGVHGARHP
jgi:hypothetical protein